MSEATDKEREVKPLFEVTTEADAEDQPVLIRDHIAETTEYYILCDGCHGCTNLTKKEADENLYEKGWRLRENDRGREFVFCPECAKTNAAATQE